MTFIQQKKANNTEWADKLVEAKGYLWATPGPYIRKGMLEMLAKIGGDVWMPEAYEQMVRKTSFTHVEGSPAKPAEVEKDYSRKLLSAFEKSKTEAEKESTWDSAGEGEEEDDDDNSDDDDSVVDRKL
jgi:hypothetical protein